MYVPQHLLWMFCLVLLLLVCRGWLVSASVLLRCPRAACLDATVTCNCETVQFLRWTVTSPSGDVEYSIQYIPSTGRLSSPNPNNEDYSATLSVDSRTSTPAINSSLTFTAMEAVTVTCSSIQQIESMLQIASMHTNIFGMCGLSYL